MHRPGDTSLSTQIVGHEQPDNVVGQQSKLRLNLFGVPQFFEGEKILHFKRRKSYALLAYLAVNRQTYTREYLTFLLFPDVTDKQASQRFRNILTDIRSVVGEDLLLTDHYSVGIGHPIVVDVRQFVSLGQTVQIHGMQRKLTLNQRYALEEAARLYTNEFLAGFTIKDSPEFDDWKYIEAQQYEGMFLHICSILVRDYFLCQLPLQAIGIIHRWLSVQPLDEIAHQMLMQVYVQNHQIDRAIHHYHVLKRQLLEQTGEDPQPQTVAIYEAMLHGDVKSLLMS